MSDIPEDVMKAAQDALNEAVGQKIRWDEAKALPIARAILAERVRFSSALRDVVFQKPGDVGAYGRAANLLHATGTADPNKRL